MISMTPTGHYYRYNRSSSFSRRFWSANRLISSSSNFVLASIIVFPCFRRYRSLSKFSLASKASLSNRFCFSFSWKWSRVSGNNCLAIVCYLQFCHLHLFLFIGQWFYLFDTLREIHVTRSTRMHLDGHLRQQQLATANRSRLNINCHNIKYPNSSHFMDFANGISVSPSVGALSGMSLPTAGGETTVSFVSSIASTTSSSLFITSLSWKLRDCPIQNDELPIDSSLQAGIVCTFQGPFPEAYLSISKYKINIHFRFLKSHFN